MDHPVMYIFMSMLVLETASLEKNVAVVCEYDDANVIWPKFQINSNNIVESRVWFKNKFLIASWTIEKGFSEFYEYHGRLTQIGQSDIKIKRATRSENGTYLQILRLKSVEDTINASTSLHVITVPPNGCRPKSTIEGQNLKAVLPSNDCVNSLLTLKWKQTDSFVMTQNGSSLLRLTSEAKEYEVCAEGESKKCFERNMSDLCTNITAKEELQQVPLLDPTTVVVPVLIILMIICLICVLIRKRDSLRNRVCRDTNDEQHREELHQMETYRSMENGQNGADQRESYALLTKSESIDLCQMKDYLQKKYMTETYIPEFHIHEGKSVNVSDVYIQLDLEEMALDAIDSEDETDLSSTRRLSFKEGTDTMKTQDKYLPPIVIVGDSGSGKSTWCKHLVHCWSQNVKMDEAEVQSMNLPDLRTFKMVLYLPLKSFGHGLSFRELLQQYLFQAEISYLDFVMQYMYKQDHFQSILTIIDGLDKIGKQYSLKLIEELLDHKLLSSSAFIFTSKPSNFNRICHPCINRAMKFFKIQELTLAKSTTYANKVLTIINKHNYTDFSIDKFLKFTEYLYVECLLKLPCHCLTLLFIWMENKNLHIEITDILLHIVENRVKNAQSCNPNIEKEIFSSCEVPPEGINKLSHQDLLTQCLVNSLSKIADKVFQAEKKISSVDEGTCHENLTRGYDSHTIQVGCELGLISEPLYLESTENQSKVIFPNMLLYNFFVSMAVALRKGCIFDYIGLDENVMLENSLIIHILCQLSPTVGKEIFNKIEKHKNKNGESQDELNKCSIIRKCKRHLADPCAESVWWLQHPMSKGELDGEKLLFLTNSLRFIDSLTVLELIDHENKTKLILWLPYSQTLTNLTLDITNCTLLLGLEWNNPKAISLKEIKIKSVSMYVSTRFVIAEIIKQCLCKIEFDVKYILSHINEIWSPAPDLTT